MAHPVDLFVNLGFFFNIGVGAGHIGFGLVVVVIAHKIFYGVFGKKPFEFGIKLGRERLIRGQDNGWTLGLFDHLGHGKGLAGASSPQQHLIMVAGLNAGRQLFDRPWLVACGLKRRVHDKTSSAFQFGAAQNLGPHGQRVVVVVGHGDSLHRPIYSVFVPVKGVGRFDCAILKKTGPSLGKSPRQRGALRLKRRPLRTKLLGQAAISVGRPHHTPPKPSGWPTAPCLSPQLRNSEPVLNS